MYCACFTLLFHCILCAQFEIESTDDIATSDKLNVATIEYKVGNFVVINECKHSGHLIFEKIVKFVSKMDDAND